MEVVDQPFCRVRDHVLLANGLRDRAIRLAQDASVILDARQQPAILRRFAKHALGRRQALGVLLEALDTEELRPDRLLEWLRCKLRGRVSPEHYRSLCLCRREERGKIVATTCHSTTNTTA